MCQIARCYTKFWKCYSDPKCVAVFAMQKTLDLESATHTLGIDTQMQKS